MCEPGVTFAELAAAVAEEGLRLNTPLLPRSTKSVVGSLLDREPVTMPKYHWDIADPLTCVEVVFGTGDIFRTGAAAGPGTLAEQWQSGGAQKEAAGPSAASWYRLIQGAQGTMGIVTWASVRCEVAPQVAVPFFVGDSGLDKLLTVMRWLIRRRLVNECFIFDRTDLASAAASQCSAKLTDVEADLPQWILFFNVAGYDYLPDLRVEGQIADMREIARDAGFQAVDHLGAVSASQLLNALHDSASEQYWKLRRRGAFHDVFFLTTYGKLTDLLTTMSELASAYDFPVSDMGVYLQPIVQGTGCHCEFSLFYDPASPKALASAKALARAATGRLMDEGAFFSRPYGSDAAVVFERDPATVAALRKVKAIVDPLHLMNPGKLCF
jgi:FAD/FMN-containing dehydrogenase